MRKLIDRSPSIYAGQVGYGDLVPSHPFSCTLTPVTLHDVAINWDNIARRDDGNPWESLSQQQPADSQLPELEDSNRPIRFQ